MTNTQSILQRNTLQAVERLKLRKQIETLFQSGEAFSIFPLRVIYRFAPMARTVEETSPVRIGFSIPKKRVKKANKRNTIKRLLREAWRTQKQTLYQTMPDGQQLHCFLIFTGQGSLTFTEAQKAVSLVMDKLIKIAAKKLPHV